MDATQRVDDLIGRWQTAVGDSHPFGLTAVQLTELAELATATPDTEVGVSGMDSLHAVWPRTAATHECPGGCGTQISWWLPACFIDWVRLPDRHQIAIIETLQYGRESASHREAMDAAKRWFQEQPGEEESV